jgi:hypothetical protein
MKNKAQKWIEVYNNTIFKEPPESIAKRHTAPDGVLEYEFSDKSQIHWDKEENKIIVLGPMEE